MASRNFSLICATLAAGWASSASAETLQEALRRAYDTNPTLAGARAGKRAIDETVPAERALGLPSLSADGVYSETVKQAEGSFNAADRQVQGTLSLNVPIYRGGAVRNAVNAAKTRVDGGKESLRATEASVFSSAVAAYMDVIRDTAIVELNSKNVGVLDVNLQATNDRFEVGDVTRTDVAQSQSRLAVARGDLENARAQLITSKENYIRVIGVPPSDLQAPPLLPNLPASPEEAIEVAIASNADIAAGRKAVEAAGYDVKVARAGALPTVTGTAQGQYQDYLGSLQSTIPGLNQQQKTTTAVVGATVTVPLFQGGRPAALTRRASELQGQAAEQLIEVERQVIAQVRSAYASWQASLQVIRSSEVAVQATSLSLEGVRAENSVGTRTVLDILDAEREFLNAQVQNVGAKRNAYVAGFTLLAAMGRAEARDLNLEGGALYNPDLHYEHVRGKILDFDLDWSDHPTAKPQATRTVDTPAQNADVSALPKD